MAEDIQQLPDLIREIQSGSYNTFERIIRHYNQILFRIGMSYMSSAQDAEDAMQNAWLKAFENLHTFRGNARFSTWLCRIMINECLMALRRNKKISSLDMNMPEKLYENSDPADKMTREQALGWLEESLMELPPEYRSVYIMREIEGLSADNAAEILNLSPENIRVRLHRAKKMLKEKILLRVPAKELFEYRLNRCDRLTASVMKKIMEKV